MPHCISMQEWSYHFDRATYISRHTHHRRIRGPVHDPCVAVDLDWLNQIGLPYHSPLIGVCTKKWILFRLAKDGEQKRPSACTIFHDGNSWYLHLKEQWLKKLNIKVREIVDIRPPNGRLILAPLNILHRQA